MVFCKELKQEFSSKTEMFAAIKENKNLLADKKKSAIKFSDPIMYQLKPVESTKEETSGRIGIGDDVYAIINTTNFLDSHGDVHIDGIWDVSVKDQKNKLYYIINHDLEIGKVIAFPGDNEAYVKSLSWKDIGLEFEGTMQALVFKAKLTEKTNKDALAAIVDGEAIQNSVRMQYISMTLCINDTSDDFKQEYANFQKYLKVIANKEDALEAGYFWAVTEAKIYKEGSAVLFGSNSATPILYNEDLMSPPKSSSSKITESPSADSLSSKKQTIYALI